MAQELERIFSLLLSPDTEIIRQATAELQRVYKDPVIVAALCDVLLQSENPHIRQLSAVLLRKKLGRMWRKLTPEERESFKGILLQCLRSEMHHLVLRSAANLVSVIAGYEFTHGEWTELSQFIMQCCQSEDPGQREIGMLVMTSVMESATLQLQPQFTQLLGLFSSALDDTGSKMVPFYALQCLTSMVEYISDDETQLFRQMIPKAMIATKRLIITDEDKACEAMDLFDELIEIEVGVITPYLQPLIEFCLEIGSNVSLGDGIRVRALSTISWLVTAKKKSLLKKGLLLPLLQTLLNIMITFNEQHEKEDEDEDDVLEDHDQRPHSVASQVIDRLALCLPPEKIFSPVLQMINPWLQQDSLPFQKKTALTAVAVMVEGCAEHIRNNHLASLVQCVYWGMQDSNPIVRNAALFTLGQLSEHLQPDITQFSSELLPALFQFLEQALSTSGCDKTSLTKTFYALETFCEHLGTQLLPYLPGLMEKLFIMLAGDFNIHYKELAISCIGAVANAVEENLLPFFSKIVESLKAYIMLPYQQEMVVLQGQAIDTLGILARTIGSSNFQPIAEESVQLGMVLMQSTDPDLRRAVFGMLASVSVVMKEAMLPHLQTIIARMLESLQSEEGVKAHYSSSAVPFLEFDNEEEEDTEEVGNVSQESLEDDQDIEGYTVENAYLEEKEDICNAIGEIAENVGVHFIPFIDDCFKEINVLTEHSTVAVRKSSTVALSRLCIVWYNTDIISGQDKDALDGLINSTLLSMSAGARTDNDSSVVLATLESIERMLKSLHGRGFVVQERVIGSVLVTVEDILSNKAQCQEEEEDDVGGFENGEIAEMDGMILEMAGSLLGPLAKLVGGANVSDVLRPIMNKIKNKLKINSSVAERSFIIGTLAEIVDGCGSSSTHLVDELYPFFIRGLSDKEDEVISNSVYGLGVLIANGLPNTSSKYQEVIPMLFALAQRRQNGRLVDNVCAAVCRLIVAQQDGVPLEQVIPVLLQNLPLKEDMEENETVYNCLLGLIQAGNNVMINNLDLVLKAFAMELLPSSKLSQALQTQIVQVIRALHVQFGHQFQTAVSCLPPPHAQALANLLSSSPVLQNGIEH